MRLRPLMAVTHEVENAYAYSELGVDVRTHVVLHFDREDFQDIDGAIVAPHPRGVSGGGIWLLENFMTEGTVVGKLVGLAIEYRATQKCIIASRPRLLTQQIQRTTPLIAPLLPA